MNKQELINKLVDVSTYRKDTDSNLKCLYIKTSIANSFINKLEPEKVTVPKFIFDEIQVLTRRCKTLNDVYNTAVWANNGINFLDKGDADIARWVNSFTSKFEQPWVNGCEPEQEQLYYVKFCDSASAHLVLNKTNNTVFMGFKQKNNSQYQTQFTEKEIEAIDPRFLQFKEKVD